MPETMPRPPKKTWKERAVALAIIIVVTVIAALIVKGVFGS